MIEKVPSTFPSVGRYRPDGPPASIAVQTWEPDGALRAVLQLNHGMVEHIERYDRFARAAAERGFLVVGMDFIGHGDSTDDPEQLGHAGVPLAGGRNVFLEDMLALRAQTQARHPGLPYFMFGHSMGSIVLRAHLAEHGAGLAGAIVCGTGVMPVGALRFARLGLRVLGLFHPADHRSALFRRLTLGGYNKPFEKSGPAPTGLEWLSRDRAEVDRYVADPRCGGTFTLSANNALIDAFWRASIPAASNPPKDLPLLLVSGGQDAVGAMGRAAPAVADRYRSAGLADVTVKVYDGARHELLNEVSRDEVTADLLAWLDAHVE